EGGGILPSLERGEALLERGTVRRAAARVEEPARVRAVGLPLEGRRRMDGRRHGPGARVDVQPGVHREGLDPPVVLAGAAHPAVKPPSTTSSAPVMNDDSSLARNSAT